MKKEKTFEQALNRLEEIVTEFEEGEIDLESMLQKYQESSELIQFCLAKLENAQKKIKELSNGQIKVNLDFQEE